MKKLNRKTKKKLSIIVITNISIMMGIYFGLLYPDSKGAKAETKSEEKSTHIKRTDAIQLDVPLEKQFASPELGNGCEVTALSMLLNYYDYETDKNQLADLLSYVPVTLDNGLKGSPKEGFVGDIWGGDNAMGADVEPIADVAEKMVNEQFSVVMSRETSLDSLLDLLKNGTPIWVKVTLDFVRPTEADFRYWDTTSGQVKVSPINHASVITGYNEDSIFVNDPYGYKDREISREDFEFIFEEMGSQSLYLAAKK
ncbi:C39 family peptidase [Enterococcus sp. JM9B]|uniref:C39 family peptidase n=1 Tax=Enterococcus sp. JM9B TaxID=1857216 RepID=UPI001374A8F2|nr:C39 family peptidase [Enterococcus sp. JM9B]KAF1304484.1 hypothetical protein BAU16_01855 [Enterococcus sp. JM9B]